MANLKIRIFREGESTPATTVTIPVKVFRLAKRFVPRSIAGVLEQEGIDLNDILALAESEEVQGTFMEVEQEGVRFVFAVER